MTNCWERLAQGLEHTIRRLTININDTIPTHLNFRRIGTLVGIIATPTIAYFLLPDESTPTRILASTAFGMTLSPLTAFGCYLLGYRLDDLAGEGYASGKGPLRLREYHNAGIGTPPQRNTSDDADTTVRSKKNYQPTQEQLV